MGVKVRVKVKSILTLEKFVVSTIKNSVYTSKNWPPIFYFLEMSEGYFRCSTKILRSKYSSAYALFSGVKKAVDVLNSSKTHTAYTYLDVISIALSMKDKNRKAFTLRFSPGDDIVVSPKLVSRNTPYLLSRISKDEALMYIHNALKKKNNISLVADIKVCEV